MNPPGKLEIGENPDLFKSDADIVEAVQKGVSEEGSKDEIEECTPPQMLRFFLLPYYTQIRWTAFFPLSPILSKGFCTFTIPSS